MKTILKNIAYILLATMLLASCTEDMNFKDAKVSPVAELYTPDEGKSIELISTAGAALFFEWEAVRSQDSGAPIYEVVFDKKDGDFSSPLYRVPSGDNGMRNYASITHKTINSVAAKAGIDAGAVGSIKWAVVSSRGFNEALSTSSRELVVKRLFGFADLPISLFITGEASETGTQLDKALQFTFIKEGEFEIYTELTADKTYNFISNKDPQISRSFYIANNIIEEGDKTVKVTKTGVYNISLDFNTAAVIIEEVKSFGLWNSQSESVIFPTKYKGAGIWSDIATLSFPEDRYKMQMELVKADGSTYKQMWGTVNPTDGKPTSPTGAYYYTRKVDNNSGQWDDKWKFLDEMNNANVEVVISLQGTAPYTHSITKK